MSFTSQPSHRPLAGSRLHTTTSEDNLVNQSRETGEVVPGTQSQNAQQITRADELKDSKPWAHFVAGG